MADNWHDPDVISSNVARNKVIVTCDGPSFWPGLMLNRLELNFQWSCSSLSTRQFPFLSLECSHVYFSNTETTFFPSSGSKKYSWHRDATIKRIILRLEKRPIAKRISACSVQPFSRSIFAWIVLPASNQFPLSFESRTGNWDAITKMTKLKSNSDSKLLKCN